MKTTSNESSRDRRLAVAAFLRDSDGRNKERMQHINYILNGQPYPAKENIPDKMQTAVSDPEEKAFRKSFRIRCAAALLLTTGVYLGIMTQNPKIIPFIKTIKTEIQADYSENLFDFIKQIPYTLEYEKINA